MRWTPPLAALLVAFAAQAGDDSPTRPGRGADADGDGIVTREEARAHPRLDARFDTVDANKDGRLDEAEMNAHREAMRSDRRAKAEERWKAADKDGDGALSREEAQSSMPRLAECFDEADVNGDGKLERGEMHSLGQQRKGKRCRDSE